LCIDAAIHLYSDRAAHLNSKAFGLCYNHRAGGIILQKYFLIALGGALGSIARYWVGSTIANRMGTKFPYGTFFINITACAIIGFTLTFLARRVDLNPAWRFLVPVGFIGAYSTFSTYEWETLSTIRSGAFLLAALYAAGSLILGLAAVWGGSLLAEIV
jgi:CrcB protein